MTARACDAGQACIADPSHAPANDSPRSRHVGAPRAGPCPLRAPRHVEAGLEAVARAWGLDRLPTLWLLSELRGPRPWRPGRSRLWARRSRKPPVQGGKGCLTGACVPKIRWALRAARASPGRQLPPISPHLAAGSGSLGSAQLRLTGLQLGTATRRQGSGRTPAAKGAQQAGSLSPNFPGRPGG